MSYSTGTATDQNDLLDKLKTFLTGVGPGWTALKDTTVAASPAAGANRYIIFEAPGGGSDTIYTGIELNMTHYNEGSLQNFYKCFFRVQGYKAVDTGLGFDQATSIPTYNNVPTFAVEWDRPLPYHFIANGRRCIIAVQSGRFWSTAYLGWYLPYATPAQLVAGNEPLMVAGSNWTGNQSDTNNREKPSEDYHIGFGNGSHGSDVGSNIQGSEGGNWVGMYQRTWPIHDNEPNNSGSLYDNPDFWRDDEQGSTDHADGDYTLAMLNLDGTPPLLPLHLVGDEAGSDVFGVYDGVYAIGGANRVLQDDIVTISAVDYLLVDAIPYARASQIAIKLD